MRLLLIRHGQTPSNVEGSLDTRIPGPGLTQLGTAQADAVPAALAGESIDGIFASVMRRTQLTAAPLARALGLDVQVRAGIREISSGDFGVRSDRAAVEAYTLRMVAWAEGDLEQRMPGGETGAEAFARFEAVLAEAWEADLGTVAFFSHGAIIRAWTGHTARNLDARYIAENPLRNGGIVVLDGSPRTGWAALSYMQDPLIVDDPVGPGVDAGSAGPAAETV